MKIAFIGCVDFSEAMLRTVLNVPKAEVCCIITRKASSFNSDFRDLTPIAEERKIPVFHATGNMQSSMESFLQEHSPDVIFCFGWSYLLQPAILNLSRLGVVGFHPAELPENRGRHPIIWALALGLKQTASTFFWMDDGADSGDILSQQPIQISDDDDAASLYHKVIETAQNQVAVFVTDLLVGRVIRLPQDATRATYWRKRGKSDGRIDFRMSSSGIHNLVRALARPYVGAHVEKDGQDYKVWKTRLSSVVFPVNIEPGKVVAVNGSVLTIKTSDSAIDILEHEFTNLPTIGEYL
ncbi:formyltransferase family protein [Bdellovibrio bacteriovorus]|uniref:Putative formyltransferase n=1 Tax=Bdellovibrio bacteriovorus (strain ATCC 15356 / DSM 50701 / NCIMB 9529 / HD100) TaxID=264462 RepID=Q6MMF2_BDEBA|nr:formyltransferase family protein [Bdellovibrio bacteriovorus]CAE79552.1 putative formyltransferase [Bdellovibrio bacteriovorus HD100]